MRSITFWFFILLCSGAVARAQAKEDPPRDWIDKDTGHRVVRLSNEVRSRTLYFHDNAYTPEGDKFIFSTPSGVASVEVAKIGTDAQQVEIVIPGASGAILARRTREAYVSRRATREGPAGGGRAIYAVNVDTQKERLVPNAVGTVINCDETFGFIVVRGDAALDPTGNTPRPASRHYVPQLQRMFPGRQLEDLTPDQRYSVEKEERLARGTLDPQPAAYTFINLKTGERNTGGYQFGNLNHQQFNPTDPNLLLFAHEGTWHEVDRTWTIRSDCTGLKLMHKRTIDMEISGGVGTGRPSGSTSRRHAAKTSGSPA
jgi:oligogalacturonide lyase